MTDDQYKGTFLVGGAVRDELLNLTVTEHDWVVVGSSIAEMEAVGFRQVGKDFPVFLHPDTNEEYALARTERKIEPGHTGFSTDASSEVTLEEDLGRRDLTINAIARDGEGNLIDPYHGCKDIETRTIRHVSDAFEEDPLRVLRVARFAAKFSSLGFEVANETKNLCAAMVKRGDLSQLPSERIFQETDKSLALDNPETFFRFLADISAGVQLWPELDKVAIDLLARTTGGTSRLQRFAILFSQSTTDKIKSRCEHLKTPRRYEALAVNCCRHLSTWEDVSGLDAEQIVAFLYDLDAIRKPEQFGQFSDTCEHLARARSSDRDQGTIWANYHGIISDITSTSVDDSLRGPAVGQAIRKLQIGAIESHHEN